MWLVQVSCRFHEIFFLLVSRRALKRYDLLVSNIIELFIAESLHMHICSCVTVVHAVKERGAVYCVDR